MDARFLRVLWAAGLAGLVAVAPATALAPGQLSPAPGARPVVYVVAIQGMIDLGLAPFVERVLDEAATTRAAAVILEINTFGGRAPSRPGSHREVRQGIVLMTILGPCRALELPGA